VPAVSTDTGLGSGLTLRRIHSLPTRLAEAAPSTIISFVRAFVYNALSLFTGKKFESLLQQP
jgi:hypothetical protein